MVESAFDRENFSPAILIPVYNHEHAIAITLNAVLQYQLPVLLVDDGSDAPCQQVLTALAEQHCDTTALLRLDQNGGKGAAVKAGLAWLLEHGYSHALQIDADGQHNLADLPYFIEQAALQSDSLISGYPVYDESIPKLRYYARYLTHIWVWINILSLDIHDAMCGFRVYPLVRINQLLQRQACGNRMEFDPEVLVRWHWQGWQIVNLPTKVHYPIDGVSHFKAWLDNLLISKMHTRLFFGMLLRLPTLLSRKCLSRSE